MNERNDKNRLSISLLKINLVLGIILLLLMPTLNMPVINASAEYWPTESWHSSIPENQAMNGTILNSLAQYLEQSSYNHDSVVIVRNGYVVFEQYYNEYNATTLHHVFSITKSVVSALIGIALNEGCLTNLDQKVLDFFPDYTFANMSSWKQEMTLEHLLTMTCGLEWTDDNAQWFELMTTAEDQIQFLLDLPMIHQPGTRYNYNSGSTHLLTAILQRVTEMSCLDYANDKLFGPIGVSKVFWEADDQGINIGGSLLALTSRDIARFGYLYLNNGSWNGQQIIPEVWVRNSTTAYLSSFLGYQMGYLWTIDTVRDYYFGMGAQGQKLCMFQQYNLVVVFTAFDSSFQLYNHILDRYIIPSVINYIPTYEAPAFGTSLVIITLFVVFYSRVTSPKILAIGIIKKRKNTDTR